MHVFSVKDVERVLRIPRSAIRTLIHGGYVAPKRGSRRQYEFSFQDLIALRTARALMLARVSPRRISQALRQLRKEVPPELPAARLRIGASGTELVVRDQSGPWRAPSGQLLLEFEASLTNGTVQILDRPSLETLEREDGSSASPRDADADEIFEQAIALEDADAAEAIRAYQRCIDADPLHAGARINCGRLLHAAGRIEDAEEIYRAGLGAGSEDVNLLFNLALILEDTGRELEAVDQYRRALALEPEFADAHYNLARLYQQLNMPRAAIRHWNCYRRLMLPAK
ncbi:MAG: tetratricopeptide repeat protein [Gammaproteobacteria bacterium]